jgi:Cu/Ag efflux pump CusA
MIRKFLVRLRGPHFLWISGGLVLVLAAGAGVVVLRWTLSSATTSPAVLLRCAVDASYPGASAEKVESQVTIPLETILDGLPHLKRIRSRSTSGLAEVLVELNPAADRAHAREEIINRLHVVVGLPAGVEPVLRHLSPGWDEKLLAFTLKSPRDPRGEPYYSLADLRTLQDWRIRPWLLSAFRVQDFASCGGRVKCYDVHPDNDRLFRFGLTLEQLEKGIAGGNADPLDVLRIPREDPLEKALALPTPQAAAAFLRKERDKTVRELRELVLVSVNDVPVRLEDIVQGGPLARDEASRGVVESFHPPRSRVQVSSRHDAWKIEERVLGLVYVPSGVDPVDTWQIREMVKKLQVKNDRLLPGVVLEPFADRSDFSSDSRDCLWIYARFPATDQDLSAPIQSTHAALQKFPEVEQIVSQIGGENPAEIGRAEIFVRLLPEKGRPGASPKSRSQLAEEIRAELGRSFPGNSWSVGEQGQDGSLEAFTPATGEQLLRIFGPDLKDLHELGEKVKTCLEQLPGFRDVRLAQAPPRPERVFVIDKQKCATWGIPVADVSRVLSLASGRIVTEVAAGQALFHVVLRWPGNRADLAALLHIRVQAKVLGDLVSVQDQLAPAMIDRENGERFVAVRFAVQGRSLNDALAEAQTHVALLLPPPYRVKWK